MRQKIVPSSMGAIASIAACLALLAGGAAHAGETGAAPDPAAGARPSQCGASAEGCARISGYIKAGAEASDPHAKRTVRLGQPPLLAGVGDAFRAGAEALNGGIGFLKVSGGDTSR